MNYNKTIWKDGVYQYPNRYNIADNGNGTVNITREVGVITQEQTELIADLMNNIEYGISQSDDSSMYKTITGSANSMMCELTEDVFQGKIVRFFAIGNNNGTATTLNGIPIYRVNSTIPPNIKNGEKVILCYNQSSNCWLYQHSAEGNATSDQVLSGYTFSNANGLSLVGTMPIISKKEIQLTSLGQTYNIPSGYYDGGSYVKAPTYQNIAGDTTVTNANQIVAGYKGINRNGLVTGNLKLDDYCTIGSGVTDANGDITISNINREIKLAIMIYNGEGSYSNSYGYDGKRLSIYDPNNLFTNDVNTMMAAAPSSEPPPNQYTTINILGTQKRGGSNTEKWGYSLFNRTSKSYINNGILTLSFNSTLASYITAQYIIFYK